MHVAVGDSVEQAGHSHMHRIGIKKKKKKFFTYFLKLDLQKLMRYNISHHIHQFSFGENFVGKYDPLNGQEIVESQLAQLKKFFFL